MEHFCILKIISLYLSSLYLFHRIVVPLYKARGVPTEIGEKNQKFAHFLVIFSIFVSKFSKIPDLSQLFSQICAFFGTHSPPHWSLPGRNPAKTVVSRDLAGDRKGMRLFWHINFQNMRLFWHIFRFQRPKTPKKRLA